MKIGSGMTWGEVYKAADEVDRAVVGAGTSTVGVGGHILGGGYGPLSFEKGLASDNVLQATVVTPTGKVLVANEFKNTDLFWAIRGVRSTRPTLLAHLANGLGRSRCLWSRHRVCLTDISYPSSLVRRIPIPGRILDRRRQRRCSAKGSWNHCLLHQ